VTVAAIDAGTTGVRCMLVDSKGAVLGLGRRPWGYSTPPNLEIAKEFDASEFWKLTCAAVTDALAVSKVAPSEIKAVATTSQRHGAVFLDARNDAVYAGPNIDARGAMTQYVIEDEMGSAYQEITGCWPPLMYSPTRLAWFEEEDPGAFSKIRKILSISDWLTHCLSGEFVTEPSAASGTGFLDVRTKSWSSEVMALLGVDDDMLPDIRQAGDVVGQVSSEAAKETGFAAGTRVVQGGSDTSCALLAASAADGEITVIAGSTTPVMLVVNRPICSADQAVWTGCHVVEGRWILESNATLTGSYLDWLVRLLCERSKDPKECAALIYDDLSSIVDSVPVGSNDTFIALGPSIMDCRRMTDIPQARMFFPQPALPQVTPLSSASLIRGVIENIAYAVRGNIEQLERYGVASCIKTVGGMTKSDIWASLLANVVGRPIEWPVESEGSLLGAAICASVGAEVYDGLGDAMQEMVHWRKQRAPDKQSERYNSYYQRWRDIWCRGDDHA
jgi:sugar (pentulose or hexulose) kinase